jgi:hypothetical protein
LTLSRCTASNRRAKEDEFGRATAGQAEDYVDAWHVSGDEETRSLAEYLGMSDDEYDIWLMTPRALPVILAARRAARPLRESVSPFYEALQAAGNADDAPALQRMGYWPASEFLHPVRCNSTSNRRGAMARIRRAAFYLGWISR